MQGRNVPSVLVAPFPLLSLSATTERLPAGAIRSVRTPTLQLELQRLRRCGSVAATWCAQLRCDESVLSRHTENPSLLEAAYIATGLPIPGSEFRTANFTFAWVLSIRCSSMLR
jgi:hypothetical protein